MPKEKVNFKFRYLPEDLDDAEEKALLYHAKRYVRFTPMGSTNELDFAWFVNAGYFGVLDARKKRKPGKGWTSYVSLKVLGAIKDALRDWDHAPRQMRQRGLAPTLHSMSVFDSKSDDSNSSHGGNMVEPELPDIAPSIEDRDWWNRLAKSLNRREGLILKLYFLEGLTMREIGSVCGIAESRVSQIMMQVLERLKTNSIVQQLKG